MRRKPTRSQLLRNVALFSGCSARELSRIASLATPAAYPAGAVLAREGKPGSEVFVIEDGKAEVTLRGRKLAVLGPGDFFGELALLDPGPRAATVTAKTPMSVLVIDPREFASLIAAAPIVGRKIMREMARRLREVEDSVTH